MVYSGITACCLIFILISNSIFIAFFSSVSLLLEQLASIMYSTSGTRGAASCCKEGLLKNAAALRVVVAWSRIEERLAELVVLCLIVFADFDVLILSVEILLQILRIK